MPRLMIVDDEPEITAMLKRYFVREGYETVTALTGAEALRKLCCAPDMVLLDVNLPDMDGFAVCRALREHLDCPVLFLTARVALPAAGMTTCSSPSPLMSWARGWPRISGAKPGAPVPPWCAWTAGWPSTTRTEP